ncbi:MAG: type II secretion system minor pseudopilin GspH [Methylovulum sp.]|nr:type II secretion system minor pseudopilin GspH [Methylovulum sp.]
MPQTKGFTLIELLIVIVLIAIMGSMAMLSIGTGNQRDQQRQEAERMLQLFQLAAQEAMIRGMPVGLECHLHGYRFLMLDNGQWHTENQDAVFRPRTLYAQLFLSLQVDKQTLLLRPLESIAPKPQIVFTPDGDTDLFQVKIGLTGSAETFTVTNTLRDGLMMATQTAPTL